MLVGNEIGLRWMRRSDMLHVLAIERMSFEQPWELPDFYATLREKCMIGRVIDVRGVVSGYIIYEVSMHKYRIVNLAVTPELRIQGLGSVLVNDVMHKMHRSLRTRFIEAFVQDGNLGGHLFFKSLGFRATGVYAEHFDDGSDAYRFVYGLN